MIAFALAISAAAMFSEVHDGSQPAISINQRFKIT